MTMPHLMNCGHSPDSWCLDCVRDMHDELEEAQAEIERLTDSVLQYERFVNGMVKHLDAARREDCKSVGEWLDAVANQYNVRMGQACELLAAEQAKAELLDGQNAVVAQEITILRSALSWYADPQNTVRDCVAGGCCANVDHCQRAREALGLASEEAERTNP